MEVMQMTRTKRTSPILEAAQERLAGLKSIGTVPDLGPDLTVAGYEADIKTVSDQLAAYNQLLAIVGQKLNEIRDLEKPLAEKNARFLAAAKGRFGPNSNEYQLLGGTRAKDRKRTGPRNPNKLPQPQGSPTTT
jgi:hypothetical protein